MGISDKRTTVMRSQSKQSCDCDRIELSSETSQTTVCRQRRHSSSASQKRYYDSRRGTALVTITILLCLSTGVSGSMRECPENCSCPSKGIALCNDKGFTRPPNDLSSTIEHLYLFRNNITTLPKQSMMPLRNLKILDLAGNMISNYALWDGVFTSFPLLENLWLQDNQITKITRDMFKGLENLARIYLQNNQISTISEGAFDNLPSLVELKLQNNRLTSFPKLENTPNLLLLDLSHNRLRTIRDMALSTVNVELLLLGDNQLTQLRTSIFDDTSRLTQLDISNNRLTAVPQVVKSLRHLRSLNMSLNKIDSIPPDTFRELRSLKSLDIHGMMLTTLQDGMFPGGVILNVFDLSDNRWSCKCGLSWMPGYINIFKDAFVDKGDRIVCSGPPRLKGRKIKDLSIDDLECTDKDKPVQPPMEPVETTTTTTTRSKAPSGSFIDPCDVYACFNGGTCVVKESYPKCKCTKDWAGPQCLVSLTTPTTTTTTTTHSTTTNRPAPPAKPQLFINSESITETSVEIILPQTDTEFLVSVSEVGQEDKPTELKIKPMTHPFTVKGLQSGRVYNICIHSPLVSEERRLPSSVPNRDSLCGTVKTDGGISIDESPLPANPETKPPKKKPESPTDDAPRTPGNGHRDGVKGGVSDPVTTTSESSDFQILYPALGAGLGAVIIVVMLVMFFFCYRQKRRLKMKHEQTDYIPGSPTDTTQSADMELTTVVHHHHHNHYQATGNTEANSQTAAGKKNRTGSRKPLLQNSTNNGKPRYASTPNQNSSLGRSSNSSNSNCGTLQTRYAETPQQYQQQYVPPGPPQHPTYDRMQQQTMNGRGNEYVYKNHQNNNNSAVPMPNGLYLPPGRAYESEIVEDMQPLVGGMNHYNYSPVEGQMYADGYAGGHLNGTPYQNQTGPLPYNHVNSRSAFQPIHSPRKNSVRTPTSESGPITTHVNTAHVLPTSSCMTRNLMNEGMPIYPEGVPVA